MRISTDHLGGSSPPPARLTAHCLAANLTLAQEMRVHWLVCSCQHRMEAAAGAASGNTSSRRAAMPEASMTTPCSCEDLAKARAASTDVMRGSLNTCAGRGTLKPKHPRDGCEDVIFTCCTCWGAAGGCTCVPTPACCSASTGAPSGACGRPPSRIKWRESRRNHNDEFAMAGRPR